MKNNRLPPGLVSNLQQVLLNRKVTETETEQPSTEPSVCSDNVETNQDDDDSGKPVVFVTNADGIDSPGLRFLVQALVARGLYSVFVCAPQSQNLSTLCNFNKLVSCVFNLTRLVLASL